MVHAEGAWVEAASGASPLLHMHEHTFGEKTCNGASETYAT